MKQLTEAMATVHVEAFDAPWSAEAFAALLVQPGVVLHTEDGGFILCRIAADEAEILTLAVRSGARRRGLGARLVTTAIASAADQGATRMFLEVAEDNAAARALYAGAGFTEAGRRPRYYARPGGAPVDALLLARSLP